MSRKEIQLFDSTLQEAFVYCVDSSLPLNLPISPTKLSLPEIIAQEDKPSAWIYLHHKDHKILSAYFTLLAHWMIRCQQLHEFVPCHFMLPLTNNQFLRVYKTLWIFKFHFQITTKV